MAAGPQTLGRYVLERVLGKGAMGIVYEALDPKLHRKVAIKTILISQLDEETAKDFSMRFVREAHAVARLNHPNIVQVYDFGEEGDVAYLVMEFIRGDELKSTLTTGRQFDRKECVRIMCELLDALDFAHEAGVVHRDIKPANVMLDSQGRTKLTDFGVARVTDADRTHAERTQAGTMVGTPAYMSPEQIQGQRIDRRTDIFSAGIILYQFLTGQKPFTGEGAWTVANLRWRSGAPRKGSRRYRRSNPPSWCRTSPPFLRPPIRRPCDPGKWNWSSGARSRTATIRTTSNSTCGSFRRACTRRSRHARPPNCAAAPPRTTAAPAPWREPTGRGSRGASPAPKPRRVRERGSTRPSSSQTRRRRNPRGPRKSGRCSCRRYSGRSSRPPLSLISL